MEFDKEMALMQTKSKKLDDCLKNFKIVEEELGHRITKQIKGATVQFKKSIYDEEDNENKNRAKASNSMNDNVLDLLKRKLDIRDFKE